MKQKKINILIFVAAVVAMYIGLLSYYVNSHVHALSKKADPLVLFSTYKPVIKTVNYSASIVFMGDIMMARTIGQDILNGENPFEYVQPELNKYDLRVANIETTIADPSVSIKEPGKTYNFNSPVQSVNTLKTAGINVASLANNHTRDYGPAATLNTITNLENAGISTMGAGATPAQAFKPLIVSVPMHSADDSLPQTVKIAFVALNDEENGFANVTANEAGSAYFDSTLVANELSLARQQANIVIVFPHWGVEYDSGQVSSQEQWAQFFISHGADFVVGSHPHVVQSTSSVDQKYVVYSLGNFIFDGMSGEALDGQMIGLNINLSESVNASGQLTQGPQVYTLDQPTSIPIHIDNSGFPHIK